MIAFLETYKERKQEIEEFLELMEFLEKKEQTKVEGKSEFSNFFHCEGQGIAMSYQSMINILKSNVSLMLYNIIEYTVSNLLELIYNEIKQEKLSYIDVNESLRKLWRKTILKAANDPNANFTTFLKKNEEIIDKILTKNTLELVARNTMPSGNLDGISIKSTMDVNGKINCTDFRH